jgi:hypothetical protein
MSRRSAMNVVLAALLTGCSGLLGIEDRPLRPDAAALDGSPGGGDGGSDGGSAADGSGGDATGGDANDGASGSAYAREVIADAPLIYLRFGEKGGAVAHDEMHHFDGAYPSFGATYAVPGALAADPDGAIALDGKSKIQMPASADFVGTVPFSVEVWLDIDPATTTYGFAIDHEAWAVDRGGWDVLGNGDGIGFERYATMTSFAAITGPALTTNAWHHILMTWDGSVQRAFYDGQIVKEGSPVGIALPAVPEGWAIGGQNCACSGNFFKGAIDELAVYDHVLLGNRVQAHLRAAGR